VAKTVRETIAILERDGWVQVRQRGSHRQFRRPGAPWTITVAGKPSTVVPRGILADIRRKTGLDELR
jgi:predicted RNA binding protein YcfA (HicA-like mRNA interferase family)